MGEWGVSSSVIFSVWLRFSLGVWTAAVICPGGQSCNEPALGLAQVASSPRADLSQPLAQHGGGADDEGGAEQAAVVQASQE